MRTRKISDKIDRTGHKRETKREKDKGVRYGAARENHKRKTKGQTGPNYRQKTDKIRTVESGSGFRTIQSDLVTSGGIMDRVRENGLWRLIFVWRYFKKVTRR